MNAHVAAVGVYTKVFLNYRMWIYVVMMVQYTCYSYVLHIHTHIHTHTCCTDIHWCVANNVEATSHRI